MQTASFFSVLEGYRQLKPRFDTRLILSGRGQDRNKLIVMHTVDVALHHLSAGNEKSARRSDATLTANEVLTKMVWHDSIALVGSSA
ncbi:MAG: hypothetical protein PUB84_02045 [Bacteroidales bacterium]|nr:hypothetical protein [Bacteroidales bacterium]MDD6775033.1 hypothetical protein [Bacteroidales bacterium]